VRRPRTERGRKAVDVVAELTALAGSRQQRGTMSAKAGPDPNEMTPHDRELAVQIDRQLRDEAGIYAAVRVGGEVAYLDGLVESAAQRDAATDLALAVAGITRVENFLDIEEFDLPENTSQTPERESDTASYLLLQDDRSSADQRRDALQPDFNDAIDQTGDDMTSDSMIAAEEGLPYMPPTDPVVWPVRSDQELTVASGFDETAMDEYPDTLATTAFGDGPPGDEDIRQQVIEALADDAATIDLLIDVRVRNGVVSLRGRVPTQADADAAEEVAGRVPTVREVQEELDIAAPGR
jgi:osmotically-inducible protein OsmY